MDKPPKASWSRKRKLHSKMEQLRAGKQTKSSIDRETPSLAMSGATLRSQEALATAASSSGTERSEPSSLDESFSVRLSVNIDSDPESESSDDDGAVDFTSTSAQHVFHDWLQQQPKEYIHPDDGCNGYGCLHGSLWSHCC